MSRKNKAIDTFKKAAPGYFAEVIPDGGGNWHICAARVDEQTGQTLYGKVIASYARRMLAENICANLNMTRHAAGLPPS